MTSTPSVRHQRVLVRLVLLFAARAEQLEGETLVSPLDVRLAAHSVVQPDLIFVSRGRRSILGQRVDGSPELLVEILSPSTAQRDRGEKLRLYAESNVCEYWIVDPTSATFEFLVLAEGRYSVHLPVDGRFRSPTVPGLAIDLADFWAGVPSEEV